MSKPLSIHTSALTLPLHHPELILGNGQGLESDPTTPPVVNEDVGRHIIHYRWLENERAYTGRGTLTSSDRGFTWHLEVAPEDGQSWSLQSTTEGSIDLSGWLDADRLTLFHGDNIRGITQGVFLTEGSYFVPISKWQQPLNIGRWQSFPGLWLFDPKEGTGLTYGVLSQDVWKHSLHGEVVSPDKISLHGRMFSPGILAKSFAAGEFYVGETIYFENVETHIPRDAYAGYLAELTQRLRPSKQPSSYLSQHAFWDSWNDREPYFWDVSQELIKRTLSILKRDFPAVKPIEVDDGYAFAGFEEVQADTWTQFEHGVTPTKQTHTIKRVRRLGVGFAYEDDYATARDRFPDGVGAGAAAISQAGLLPAIWLGLSIVKDARIVLNHPDWLVSCTPQPGDDPELAQVFSGSSANRLQVLDPSVPDVRAYLDQIFDILFREWKYEALKLDFWTYAFENDSFRLRNSDQSALELRRWLFSTIREYLPNESFLIACCDISTGNPFFSPWVDTIRYGIDIGNGKWENIRYSALTGTYLLHVEAWRFYFLNPDSVGVLKNLPEAEKRCFVAWCAATRSLCEIAGDLALADPRDIRPLQKLLLAPQNGQDIRFGEHEHLARNEPAAIVFAHGDLFSKTTSPCLPTATLAIFNWSDEPRTFEITHNHPGSAIMRNGWMSTSTQKRNLRSAHRAGVSPCPPAAFGLAISHPYTPITPRLSIATGPSSESITQTANSPYIYTATLPSASYCTGRSRLFLTSLHPISKHP